MSNVLSTEDIKRWEERQKLPIFQLKSLFDKKIFDLIGYLEGRILTIVDASIQDKEQRKAMKDLMRAALRGEEYHTQEFYEILLDFDNFSGINSISDPVSEEEFVGKRGRTRCQEGYFKK